MKNKTIEDILICPNCGSDDCYEYSTDEISFDATVILPAHYYVDCSCNNCGRDFRLCFEFEYNITKHWVR